MPEAATAQTSESPVRMAELLGAFSVASSIAIGLPMEHGVRACYISMKLARELELPPQQTQDLYWTELLKDAGCTCWTSPIATAILGDEIIARKDLFFGGDPNNMRHAFGWLMQYVGAGAPLTTRVSRMADFFVHGKSFWQEGFYSACQVARRIAQRLGMSGEVQAALLSIFEQWDGKGMPEKTRGEAIPLISRIVYATTFLEVFHQIGGRDEVRRLASERSGKAFDPSVIDAFLSVSSHESFWEGLEQENVWDAVLDMEPQSPHWHVSEEELDTATLALADFADLKSPYMVSHSRDVAALAEDIAIRLRLPDAEVTTIRRAALVHDIGMVTVPSFVINKPQESLTQPEWEQLRLHPYHGERIISRIPALRPLADIVGHHHEQMDGKGYHRGISGNSIPLGARIIAVADTFSSLTNARPMRPALDPEDALTQIYREAGQSLYGDACRALADNVGGVAVRKRVQGSAWPSGLTDREVEVLQLLSNGMTRKQIAKSLIVSESTVRHHLEHIYGKIGVSSRASAALFAMEHGLLA